MDHKDKGKIQEILTEHFLGRKNTLNLNGTQGGGEIQGILAEHQKHRKSAGNFNVAQEGLEKHREFKRGTWK